ncbi:MAG: acyltransferase [Lachnospiraceae bacterium]|jgi:surface polysaccharide O-acyltransferase-like enzyme|nr:acyltransferase [Lachnospiraceae bacterium]
MPEPKRQTNFELLRIVAMLLVVTMNFAWHAGLPLRLTDTVNAYNLFGTALESLCVGAVNVFVILTGYFMVKAHFQFRRFFRLLCQVLFYTLLIPLVLALWGLPLVAEEEGAAGAIAYILPVSTGHYWFITAYVPLYLISPFLNTAFQKIPQKQLGRILIIMLALYSGIKSFVPFSLRADDFGYGLAWFVCLYLTGAYIRIYGVPILDKKGRGLLLYLASAAMIFAGKMAGYYFYGTGGLSKYFFEIPFHYNFLFAYLAAVGLFVAFAQYIIKEGRAAAAIRWVAPLVLGVYLLHMNIDIRDSWYSWTQHLFGGLWSLGFVGMVGDLLVTVLLVFLAGIAVDSLRRAIFVVVEKKLVDEYYAGKGGKVEQ